ncbi:hypothetical protein [Clostridium butyricum]|uniref:hypothetical protein n=1 Tax=Clostridium butyricum TaxID=1492 RepID=UPI0024B91AF1|nr:hypothetical protein [Clostridium butyricum]
MIDLTPFIGDTELQDYQVVITSTGNDFEVTTTYDFKIPSFSVILNFIILVVIITNFIRSIFAMVRFFK